ncbi:MAG: RecX family transcriptional regulator [Alphaproteobacteria bacterium]|nr:RecX family transcriptional regulator [Alphaproteobacteria bacterium]
MNKTPRRVTAASLENAALHYLERFATSSENLRRVLLRRVRRSAEAHGDDPAEGAALVEALIARWRSAGLLDDAAYAETKVQALHRRGASPRAIRMKLASRGVEAEVVEGAVEALGCEADFEAAVNLARRRRLGPFRAEAARADSRQRDLATMGRAGFGWEVARRVIDAENPDALVGHASEAGPPP